MTDAAFADVVAQIAHALAGYSAVLTLVVLGVHHAVPIASAVVIVYALIKEFWWDYRFEDAVTRGSSVKDFCFYMVGLAIGIGVSVI